MSINAKFVQGRPCPYENGGIRLSVNMTSKATACTGTSLYLSERRYILKRQKD